MLSKLQQDIIKTAQANNLHVEIDAKRDYALTSTVVRIQPLHFDDKAQPGIVVQYVSTISDENKKTGVRENGSHRMWYRSGNCFEEAKDLNTIYDVNKWIEVFRMMTVGNLYDFHESKKVNA